jgi:hypothetical protein
MCLLLFRVTVSIYIATTENENSFKIHTSSSKLDLTAEIGDSVLFILELDHYMLSHIHFLTYNRKEFVNSCREKLFIWSRSSICLTPN